MDEHLAGNAADVEASPAKGSHLDERNTEVVEPLVDDRISGTGTDDAEVEVPHSDIVPANPRRRYSSVALAAHLRIGTG